MQHVSVDFYFNLYFSYFTDDFSCTSGLKLNPTGCILVVVTAVDVLTNSEISTIRQDARYAVKSLHGAVAEGGLCLFGFAVYSVRFCDACIVN